MLLKLDGKHPAFHARNRGRLGAAVAAGYLIAVFAGPSAAVSSDDAQIFQKLRPEQREYLVVVSRDGSPRLVSNEPPRVLAKRPKAPSRLAHVIAPGIRPTPTQVVAVSKPQPKPSTTFVRSPGVGQPVPSAHILTLTMPALRRSAKPVLDAAVAHPAPSAPDFIVSYGRSFVSTTTTEKPTSRPPPIALSHDLAWEFAHRFETPGPDEVRIPGVRIRSQVASPFDIKSGAFHGVRSVNGWSAIRVRVSIPCGAAHFATGYGYNEVTRSNGIVDQETGFIYIGGWGAGPRGVAVDAGLQKASAQAEGDDYAFYFKFANNHPITYPIRFPCGGSDPIMELYPISNSLLLFSITGVTDQHRRMTLTIVQQTREEDGWAPSGGSSGDGIILKRIVAIAQPKSWRSFFGLLHGDRFTNGSYFGVNNAADRTPRITWQSCEIGRVTPPAIEPHYREWSNPETWYPATTGIYLDWPPADVFRSTNGVCDAIGISLRSG